MRRGTKGGYISASTLQKDITDVQMRKQLIQREIFQISR